MIEIEIEVEFRVDIGVPSTGQSALAYEVFLRHCSLSSPISAFSGESAQYFCKYYSLQFFCDKLITIKKEKSYLFSHY